MTITTSYNNEGAIVHVTGRLDSSTSKKLADELAPILAEAQHDITLDFSDLQFISSAGLRIIFSAHKKCKTAGKTLEIVGANASIKEVFDITGYSGI